MKTKKKETLVKIAVAAVLVLALVVYFALTEGPSNFADKYAGVDLTAKTDVSRNDTYVAYQNSHKGAVSATETVTVDVLNPIISEGAEVKKDFNGSDVILTQDPSKIAYSVNIPQTGLYNIYVEYYSVESRGIDVERAFYIFDEKTGDYALPFSGCDALTFSRVWTDKTRDFAVDNQGNQIRPSQVEEYRWESAFLKDYRGYEIAPYEFYFEKGEAKICFKSVNEPVAIRKIELRPIAETTTYAQYKQKYESMGYKKTEGDYVNVIQGESAPYRSSPSLYATFDHSSPITEPYSVSKTIYNMTGGTAWRVAGDWIEWELEVPRDGLYEISIKGRQNYNRGFVSNRCLYIDGEIPFEEVAAIAFPFSSDWEMKTLADQDGNPYLFALSAGKHTLRMEVTLGELGDMLQTLDESVARLNKIYRNIIVLTGTEPDQYRDYHIDQVFPELTSSLKLESQILYSVMDRLIEYSGEKGAQVASAETLATQMERYAKKPAVITKTLPSFKENVSALGNTVLTLSEAQLDIDMIVVSEPGAKIPTSKANFFKKAAHEIRSFIASFTTDYDALGDVYDGDDVVEVWILTGRDQSTILKTMVDDTFIPMSGIKVNVKLVNAAALMPAVIAGTGPDVVLSVGQGDPVNYAIRGAAYDLNSFPDCQEVIKNYYESAVLPYRFENGIYALPETQNYNVMFYRTDILEELGLEPPETWDDLIAMLPTIQNANMNVGIPSVERKINGTSNPDLTSFFAIMYQNGGTLYNAENSRVLLDQDTSIKAFEIYTKFFTHYKTPRDYDFANRFRTGEMPLAMADYNTFNTLAVFAPEIKGLWKFALVPGTRQADGTVDHSTGCWGTASMMLKNCKNPEKAWEFLKWWASAEAQKRYGQELEAVMGAAARYATANRAAFMQLGWSTEERDILLEQWSYVKCNPEVPGGYYTARHITNAVRRVMNLSEDARETLLDYTRTINDELRKKRIEFGLEEE